MDVTIGALKPSIKKFGLRRPPKPEEPPECFQGHRWGVLSTMMGVTRPRASTHEYERVPTEPDSGQFTFRTPSFQRMPADIS